LSEYGKEEELFLIGPSMLLRAILSATRADKIGFDWVRFRISEEHTISSELFVL
jgi:hypothetical protein